MVLLRTIAIKHRMEMSSCLTYTAAVPELKAWLTGATVATDRVKTVLIAWIGLLALVHI